MKNKNFLKELPKTFREQNTLPVLYTLLKKEALENNAENDQVLLEAESRFYKSHKSPCEKFYKPISKIV
jgi:hypothetical protein